MMNRSISPVRLSPSTPVSSSPVLNGKSNSIQINNNNNNINGATTTTTSSSYKRLYNRARQQFSFQELAGTDLTLLMEESLLIRVFQFLSYHDLFVVKRVCSRWRPLCENKDCYAGLDMQSFIHNCRYLPKAVLAAYISTLDMEGEEIDALKMVCREIPRVILPDDPSPPPQLSSSTTSTTATSTTTTTTTTSKSNGINGFLQDLSSSFNSISSLTISGGSKSNGHLRTHSSNGIHQDDTFGSLTSSNSSNGSLSSSYESPSLMSSNSSSTPTSTRTILEAMKILIKPFIFILIITENVDKETQKKEKLRREREKRMEEAIKNMERRYITELGEEEIIKESIPSLSREKAWPLLIGNDLNITPELFSIFGARAERAKQKGESSLGREGTVTLIQLDLPRTFPMLSIFQNEGPYHHKLAAVLEAYVCYRPDVGYVQGMSYLAAIFLLILDEYQAFVCLSNLLNNPCYMTFYTMNLPQMEVYMRAMDSLLQIHIPKVHRHLKEMGIQPDIFMIDWVLTIFSKALPLDVATHVWDYLFLEKETFIFQVALGILKMYSKELETGDFDQCMTLLTHLPPDIDDDELFQHIATFNIKPEQFAKLLNEKSSP
ncbi:RabGAP/TBC domain-containing protein [Heterostelium album PN500]|uniref:RabGAP/TBC domain-containing protein n=1 Tax=Heterostelium pallidum (strain ATCC 26659 / Pp 5 / PN500) TaxID=670386 RepID=D3BIZ5_HETP5|nr:RabGAP/TBC domain-containing protein [Heterostelium album PN500]EFA78769.1 RabGAP/TBC domain-containing protein [Heterostelium album PN500]|eukprot:XP_020430893.1 RabGAP/TBC domain-containing protein [Heterostelium album PN500]